jgi:uncharacterized protein
MLVIIEKPMRVFSKESDQMLREGNGWEVIDEEQAVEIAKYYRLSKSAIALRHIIVVVFEA